MKIAPKIALTDEERTVLERWSRGRSTPARLVLRSRIVLLAAEGKMNQKIAPRLRTALKTVSLWRRRFAEQRIAGIEKDAPRGGRPKISKRMARLIVEKTTQERPANAIHHPPGQLSMTQFRVFQRILLHRRLLLRQRLVGLQRLRRRPGESFPNSQGRRPQPAVIRGPAHPQGGECSLHRPTATPLRQLHLLLDPLLQLRRHLAVVL